MKYLLIVVIALISTGCILEPAEDPAPSLEVYRYTQETAWGDVVDHIDIYGVDDDRYWHHTEYFVVLDSGEYKNVYPIDLPVMTGLVYSDRYTVYFHKASIDSQLYSTYGDRYKIVSYVIITYFI